MLMQFLIEIKEYLVFFAGITAVLVTGVNGYTKWRGIKSNETLRSEYQKSFNDVVNGLSSSNISRQLTSAILLRRFFNIDEMSKGGDFLKDETINVVSSLLRTLSSGVFQKTVGDSLAYAKDLTKADLQRTNLQDVYLEGKNERLILRGCDLFMADLSYALIKNVDAEGAYFYHSILLKARFKNCNLKNADFRCADLSKVTFENVELHNAKFEGAINIPAEIKDNLDSSGKYKDAVAVSTSQSSVKGYIFFSIPGCASIEDNALVNEYKNKLEAMHYEVKCYTRDKYPKFGQLNKIRKDILQSSAMVVFGLKQIKIEKATFRPNTDEETVWVERWMHTPWNEIEVGLGAMLGLPILLVKDSAISSGIFDENLSESFISSISASENVDSVFREGKLNTWLSKIG